MNSNRTPLWLVKLIRYEFWPVYVFYAPFVLYWIYLSLKVSDFSFLFKINPSMTLGGAIGSNKIKSLDKIPSQYKPITLYFSKQCKVESIIQELEKSDINYPLIAKPNNGERGKGVERIENLEELNKYLKLYSDDLLIQEYVESLQELGIFYYKDPSTGKGYITSIVVKRFLNVVGNGLLTLEQLMSNNLRARFRLKYLKEKYKKELNTILDEGEVKYLEPVGNHCRGTEFLSGQHLINADLVKVFDDITSHFPDFDYGRFDIKIKDLDHLYKGEGIKILEVNGVNAEPAHVYDRSYNLFKAYKDVKKQIDLMYYIYCMKYRYKAEPLGFAHIVQTIREHIRPI